MIYHTRGETVNFSYTFYDADGLLTTVDSASLTIIFPGEVSGSASLNRDPGALKGKTTIAMTDAGDGTWTASWDSSDADEGQVYWSIKSVNPVIVEDGVFILRANLANIET